MNRRDFINSAAIFGGAFALPALSSEKQVRFTTVISGIHPGISSSHLKAVLDAFMAMGLPVTCVVNIKSPDGTLLVQNSEVAKLIQSYLRRYSGLVEIAGFVENLAIQSPYFQSRSVFHVKSYLQSIFDSTQGDKFAGFQLQSIACLEAPTMLGPTGVRSAGIRNVLTIPNTSKPVTPELWDGGVLRLIGGSYNAIQSAGIPSNFPTDIINYVSILNTSDIDGLSIDTVSEFAANFAQTAVNMEGAGKTSNQRLGDLQFRDDYRYKRLVAVHIFEPSTETELDENTLERFKNDLNAAEIPFSTGSDIVASNDATNGAGYWVSEAISPRTDKLQLKSQPESLFKYHCDELAIKVVRKMKDSNVEGIGVIVKDIERGLQGIDKCGHLILPLLPAAALLDIRASSTSPVPQSGDFVLGIHPEDIQSGAKKSNILRHLNSIKTDWITELTTIEGLTNSIRPKSNLVSVFRKTEATAIRENPNPQKLSGAEKQLLIEDAKVAWNYFEKITNQQTGLCPATINTAIGGFRIHKVVTMWDVGSQINALIAAVDLGLISDKKFQKNIAKILTNIKGRRSQDRLLPQGWIRTDKHKWGNANFDGCDAGRLLASLRNLHEHRLSTGVEADLVKSWDLDKIIIDGIIHSVIKGVLKPAYLSQCGHYSAIAFRYWGHKVSSPYEMNENLSETDRKLALLDAVSKIGPVGAEPLLMEAMDFGLAKDTQYLADVLFTAQLDEFEKNGEMISVSEGPIDKAPWFTYQGLQIDDASKKWRIKGVVNDDAFATDEAQIAYRVISSKAAYLWNTSHPHSFSTALLEFVRKKAKFKYGFASSIYSTTLEPTSNYTDINTNGVILQAIAQRIEDDTF